MSTSLQRLRGPAVLSMLGLLMGCGGAGNGAKGAADESGGGSGHAEVGRQAPDLSIHALNGKGMISLQALQGKVVIVDFWATWCPPCKQSFPKLEALSTKVGDNVRIVGISVDVEKQGILEFAKELGATFAIGWDEGQTLASQWRVRTMPTTFIVDGSGKIRYVHDGYHDGDIERMEKELAALAEERSPNAMVAKGNQKKTDESKIDDKRADDKKGDEAGASATPSPRSGDEDKSAPPSSPTKRSGKKGRGSGKPPAKKHTKKKV